MKKEKLKKRILGSIFENLSEEKAQWLTVEIFEERERNEEETEEEEKRNAQRERKAKNENKLTAGNVQLKYANYEENNEETGEEEE